MLYIILVTPKRRNNVPTCMLHSYLKVGVRAIIVHHIVMSPLSNITAYNFK